MKDLQVSEESHSLTPASHGPSDNHQNNTPETPVAHSSSVSVPSDNDRAAINKDIDIVLNLIERCLQLYMTRDEVVNRLLIARIVPAVTNLVWQRLEEQNADFFRDYYRRLKLKEQILLFNQLLEQQANRMNCPAPMKVPSVPIHNQAPHMPVSTLPMGSPVTQQLPIPSDGDPQMGSFGNMPSSPAGNEVPAPHNFLSGQLPLNFEKENLDNSEPTSGTKDQEISFSPISAVFNGQFTFAPPPLPELDFNESDSGFECHFSPLLHSTYTSPVGSSEGLQLGTYGEKYGEMGNSEESMQQAGQIPWNYNFSDLVAPELTTEEVEFFLADRNPEQAAQSDQDKPTT